MSGELSGPMVINPEQAVRAMALCYKAERLARKHGLPFNLPVVLVGPTGSAKSASVREFVRWLNDRLVNGAEKGKEFGYWHCPLSLFVDVGDYGIPVPDHKSKTMEFFGHGNIPFDVEDAAGVLNFDEIDRASDPSVATAAGTIMLEKAWHGKRVSDNVFICGTMNGTADIQTGPLSEFIRTRCVTLFMGRHVDGMGESYDEWAQAHGISPVARVFRKFRQDLIAPDPVYEELAVCQDRTKDMADLILQASKMVKFDAADVLLPCIAGAIGRKAAIEFMATERLVNEAPSIEEIIANPDKAKIPDSPSVIYAVCCGMAGMDAAKLVEKANAIATYGARLTPEFAAMLFKRVSKIAPRIVTTPEFQKWVKENKALLI